MLTNAARKALIASLGPRQLRILQRVERDGFASIDDMSQDFSVTPQTIRRDINWLCRRGLLRRYHGGAGLPSTVENVAYNARRVLNFEEKKRIGELVAQHIPDQASLFVSLGTTAKEAAKALRNHKDLRVITNNINVAFTLRDNASFQVMVTGGLVRARDAGITGEATIDFVRQFRVDFALMGISSVGLDGSLFEFDYREVRVLRAIMQNSRKVFLLADHSKFGRDAMVRLGDVSEIDALFTSAPPPESLRAALAKAETALLIA